MNRRSVLELAASSLLVTTPACLEAGPSSPTDGSGDDDSRLAYEARTVKDPNDVELVAGGLDHGSEDRYYTTLLTRESALGRFDFSYMADQADIDDGTISFVRETDFTTEVLVVIQTVLSSGSNDFEVDEIRRESPTTIHADVRTPPATGGTGEALRATILARVSIDGDDHPDRVVVTYTDESAGGGEVTFSSDGA